MEPNGILNLTFKKKENGETYLSNQFFKLPLQIFPPDAREDGSVQAVVCWKGIYLTCVLNIGRSGGDHYNAILK